MTELPPTLEPAAPYVLPTEPKTSGSAVASLIFGILSFCTVGLTAIPGIILGILGLRSVSRGGGQVKGSGLAIAGLVTSTVGLCVWLFVAAPAVMGLWLFYHAEMAARQGAIKSRAAESPTESAARSMIGMKTEAAVVRAFAEEHSGRLPTAAEYPETLEPYYKDQGRPLAPAGRRFAMNKAVAGLRLADILKPERTVLLFETREHEDLVGGKDLLRTLIGSDDAYVIAFVDGHVEWLTQEEVDGLIWQPEPEVRPIRL